MSSSLHDLRVSLRDKVKQIEDLERVLGDLRQDLKDRDSIIREQESKLRRRDEIIASSEISLKEKDNYIKKLESELAKLNANKNDDQNKHNSPSMSTNTNVVTIPLPKNNSTGNKVTNTSTSSTNSASNNNNGIYGVLNDSTNKLSEMSAPDSSKDHTSKLKRIAISAEPAQMRFDKTKNTRTNLRTYDKSEETRNFLKNAIFENDFLKNLEIFQIESIVDCMYPVEFDEDSMIITEGDIGDIVYIIEEGRVEVRKNSKLICKMGCGRVFGELAILYNCTRTASIKALTPCKLWATDRTTFKAIMMRFGMEKHDEYMELLKNIPIFQGLREDVLVKFIDIIDDRNYNEGEFIVRQFAKGDTFYVISKGRVQVTKSAGKWDEAKFVRYMHRGEFFGENALLEEETRDFNVIADDPNGVSCLVLDRQSYDQLFQLYNDPQMNNLKRNSSLKMYKRAQTQLISIEDDEELDLDDVRLSEFEILGTLGLGGFGRVELVRNSRDMRTYALKVLKKQHIVQTKQQDHILNERNILFDAKSPFICRLYKTFKDKKYLYLLLEVCLGGELWSLLRERGSFEEHETKFYAACVLEALAYLHSKGIVYRDLKPENIILNAKGYCKLVDFGFAKKVGLGKKTWTFCGTPEYVAPEVILNKGHDIGADYWSTGVLIFELLTGNPPFMGTDPMATYNIILKGIEAIDFPRKIPKVTATLIKRLCKENAVDRIGYSRGGIKDVQKHKWFEGFSWESLRAQTLESPYIPNLKDNTDLCNFDSYGEDDNPEPEDDLSGWDVGF